MHRKWSRAALAALVCLASMVTIGCSSGALGAAGLDRGSGPGPGLDNDPVDGEAGDDGGGGDEGEDGDDGDDGPPPADEGDGAAPPSFVIIISDDQRAGTLQDYMPITRARIFDEGIRFRNGYVTTPLCCPSRSSIFTGQYARHHGVHDNPTDLFAPTVTERLHDAGYFTGLVGKYLNSWPGDPRPEYDYWSVYTSGNDSYWDRELNVDGVWQVEPGYLTHVLRDHALEFLDEAAARDQPFILFFDPKAPHIPADAAPGDENLYLDVAPNRPPNWNEDDVSDKPQWLQDRAVMDEAEIDRIDDIRLHMLQAMWSLDEAVGEILDRLAAQGRLDTTFILYMSDNGYFWGEHRLSSKWYVYEEATHVPFGIRYPPLVAAGQESWSIVANIDIAPTLCELAGIDIPAGTDGRSLVPLLRGEGGWRDDILLEAWPPTGAWSAVHTERWVYVETEGDTSELYDLDNDPKQLDNLIGDPNQAGVIADLSGRLHAY